MEFFVLYIVIAVFSVYWIWKKLNNDVLKNMGISHPKALPIFGNIWPIIAQKMGQVDLVDSLYEKYKNEKVFGFYNFFNDPAIIFTDPTLINQIGIKDFEYFSSRTPKSIDLGDIVGRSLLVTHDKVWKDMRNVLTPIYTSAKLKQIFHVLNDCVTDFVGFYDEKAKKSNGTAKFETEEAFARVTADGISTTAFGLKTDSTRDKESQTYDIANTIMTDVNSSLKLLLLTTLPRVAKLLKIRLVSKKVEDYFDKNILREIKRRKELNIVQPDAIHQLLQAQDEKIKVEGNGNYENTKRKWTDNDLVGQGFTIFLGGFSTTTDFMEACCYELTMNPKIQQTLTDEVDEMLKILDGGKISYEQLNGMKYLDMVINETLRKFPSVGMGLRVCVKDYEIKIDEKKSLKIKEGTSVFIPYRAVLNDPDYFPDPKKFDPERFSEENKANIKPGTLLGFGLGPRLCLGSRYALLESKLLLFTIISKFTLIKCEETPETVNVKLIGAGFREKVVLGLKLRN